MNYFVEDILITADQIKRLVPLDVALFTNGEVRVFLWQHTYSREALTRLAHELSPDIDLDDIAQLRDKRYVEKLSIRLLLKQLLPQATIDYMETGRPYLLSSDIEISISHTKSLYAISFSRERHGMDVEHHSKTALKVARMYVNDREQTWINQETFRLGKIEVYTALWSAKEAIYKYVDIPGLSFKDGILTESPKGAFTLLATLPQQHEQCIVGCIPYPEFELNVAKKYDKAQNIKQETNSLELPF